MCFTAWRHCLRWWCWCDVILLLPVTLPLNPSPLAPQIRLCWPLCAFINYIYLLLTYLLESVSKLVSRIHIWICTLNGQFHWIQPGQFHWIQPESGFGKSNTPWKLESMRHWHDVVCVLSADSSGGKWTGVDWGTVCWAAVSTLGSFLLNLRPVPAGAVALSVLR